MPETHSKMAVALAEALLPVLFGGQPLSDTGKPGRERMAQLVAQAIDERLAAICEYYKPKEFARCPVVSHHGKGPCQFCVCAAMREFILLPEDL